MKIYFFLTLAAIAIFASEVSLARDFKQSPYLDERVLKKELPNVLNRLPVEPAVADINRSFREIGQYGGSLRMIFGRSKDIRLMTVYGYARLIGYNHKFELVPDILQDVKIEKGGREFILKIRKGHKWSDGHPFTAEDFRSIMRFTFGLPKNALGYCKRSAM